jgi:hypothetical protein
MRFAIYECDDHDLLFHRHTYKNVVFRICLVACFPWFLMGDINVCMEFARRAIRCYIERAV